MSVVSPRALEDSMRPRRLVDASGLSTSPLDVNVALWFVVTPAEKISLIDLGKAAIGFCASLAWVGVAVRFVRDTPGGAATLAVPLFVILGTSAYFLHGDWGGF
jgi:hypothetical protein